MNLLPGELVSVLEFINSLRNKIAHELDFEISDESVVDLTNCTPKSLREIAEEDDEHKSGPLRFNELLRVVLFQIEVLRQGHEFNRLSAKKATLRLGAVLDRIDVVYNG